ncbi:type IV pilus twitching motility protein PilT [Patescibacteria group bacterium]|nr:MAG: type IV pilus twitching motility protein PilT [Patescibacteria group bacterium]
MGMEALLKEAVKRKASDVHLAAGHPPMLRVDGELVPLKAPELTGKAVETLAREIAGEAHWKRFTASHEEDFAFDTAQARFRVNLHVEQGRPAFAARLIPHEIPSYEELGLPESIQAFTDLPNGLVIITGPAGTGKSTTLASMLQDINERRGGHIVTLEDPIEYVFPQGKGLVKQREVGTDTASFAEALRRALRQDPDVIMVGEMRDPETIAAALTLAETGHLVFSTLHTSSAAQAVHRIVDSFSGPQQEQVRQQLSLSLRAVVAQTLLPAKKGGLVAAREILVNNAAVSNLIRENKVEQIASAIQTGRADGMISMEKALGDLVDEGLVEEEAVAPYLGTGDRTRRRR